MWSFVVTVVRNLCLEILPINCGEFLWSPEWMWVFVVWVTDEIQDVQDRLSCMKLVTSRNRTLSIATHLIRKHSPWIFNTSIRFNIMLTNTHHCYLPKLVQSFPHHDIQFSKFHLIIKIPSLSRSPTYLLLFATLLKQIPHELNNTPGFVA